MIKRRVRHVGAPGAVVVLFLFISLAFFWFALFALNIGRSFYVIERAQTTAEMTALSSLRMRSEGLKKIAERWEIFGSSFTGGNSAGASAPRDYFDAMAADANTLARALPGYKARISSVIKVVSEANGISRENVEIIDNTASQLGLIPQDLAVIDETDTWRVLPAGWYKRAWDTLDDVTAHAVRLELPLNNLKTTQVAQARLRWDVRGAGNGGFPSVWAEALDGGQVRPHRYPYYWAELVRE